LTEGFIKLCITIYYMGRIIVGSNNKGGLDKGSPATSVNSGNVSKYAVSHQVIHARIRDSNYVWLRENGKVLYFNSLGSAKERAKTCGGSVYQIGKNLQDKDIIGTYSSSPFHPKGWRQWENGKWIYEK
jgi:hypothetical protein